MKYIFRYITLLAVVLFGAASCNEAPVETEKGFGELEFLSIDCNGEVIVSGEASAATRASLDLSDHIFSVDIYDIATEEKVQSYANHRDIPSTIVLSEGKYRIEVYTADLYSQLPEGTTVGFAQPQYGATKEVEIFADEITSITVTATSECFGVTVNYSDTFLHMYPCSGEGETYYTTIYSSDGAEITFEKGETRTAFFKYTGEDMFLSYRVHIVRLMSDGSLQDITTEDTTPLLPSDVKPTIGYIYNATIAVEGN